MYILPQYAIERKRIKPFIRTKVFIGNMNIKKLKDALSISFQIQLLIERITLLPLNYTRYM